MTFFHKLAHAAFVFFQIVYAYESYSKKERDWESFLFLFSIRDCLMGVSVN